MKLTWASAATWVHARRARILLGVYGVGVLACALALVGYATGACFTFPFVVMVATFFVMLAWVVLERPNFVPSAVRATIAAAVVGAQFAALVWFGTVGDESCASWVLVSIIAGIIPTTALVIITVLAARSPAQGAYAPQGAFAPLPQMGDEETLQMPPEEGL